MRWTASAYLPLVKKKGNSPLPHWLDKIVLTSLLGPVLIEHEEKKKTSVRKGKYTRMRYRARRALSLMYDGNAVHV